MRWPPAFRPAWISWGTGTRGSPAEYLDRLDDLLTAEFLPIRLLGDRYAIERTTTTWNRTVVDREPQLNDWARLIRRSMEQMLYVSAFPNNHYAGFAPATARRLAEVILGTAPALPAPAQSLAAPGATLFDPPHGGIG